MPSKKKPWGDLDPEAQYQVKLTQVVRYGRSMIRPDGPDGVVLLKGKVIQSEEVSPYVDSVLPVAG